MSVSISELVLLVLLSVLIGLLWGYVLAKPAEAEWFIKDGKLRWRDKRSPTLSQVADELQRRAERARNRVTRGRKYPRGGA